MDMWFVPFLTNLLSSLPVHLVQLVGVVLAFVRWHRHPRISLLFVIAVVIAFVISIFSSFLYAWLPMHAQEVGWDAMSIGTMFAILNMVRSLLFASVWVLVLCAVFGGRGPAIVVPREPSRQRLAPEPAPPVVTPLPASPASEQIYRREP